MPNIIAARLLPVDIFLFDFSSLSNLSFSTSPVKSSKSPLALLVVAKHKKLTYVTIAVPL